MQPVLDVVDMPTENVLYPGGAEEDLEYVYFPIDSVTSMLTLMVDGNAVEAGTVGREGMCGAQSAFGSARILERWISQVPGTGVRIRVADFRAQFASNPTLRVVVQRWLHAYMSFLAQSTACNRLHVLVERCARWLLLTHDRVGRDDFPLTQEFLALMLGVRRPGVSVAASTLQNAGFITYSRGHVRIANAHRARQRLDDVQTATTFNVGRRRSNRSFGEAAAVVVHRQVRPVVEP